MKENNRTNKYNNPNRQGTIVCLAGIAEERPFSTYREGTNHYSSNEFLDVLGYSIAHELFHLLAGKDHNTTPNTVFGLGPYLSTLTTSANEISQINLKTRKGVTR